MFHRLPDSTPFNEAQARQKIEHKLITAKVLLTKCLCTGILLALVEF